MALTIAELRDLVNVNLADNSNIEPLEHRAVELAIIDYLETLQPISNSNRPVNKGYITANNLDYNGGVEVGIDIITTLTPKLRWKGDVTALSVNIVRPTSVFTVTMPNAMPNNNYVVKSWLELVPTSSLQLPNTSSVPEPVFKIISPTQFQIVIREYENQQQALRLHFETYGY